MAQPSLSQQVIKLEKELGQPLFDRLGRRVQLTEAGRALYDRAVSILADVDEAKRRVVDVGESGVGEVHVGAIPTIAPYLLPAVFKQFHRRFPNASPVLHENLTEATIGGVVAGQLDVGILAMPIENEQLVVETLGHDELLLVTSADHPLADKQRVTMADVAEQPFVLLSETHCLGEQIVSFCGQQSCRPLVSCHSAQLLTVQELVALGHGVSLIPRMAAVMDRSRTRKYRSLHGARPSRTLALVWHKHRHRSPLVMAFQEMVRAAAGRLGQAE
ncbi:MAG: LysR substrate-binding domain-containing protein [Pirellulales bacterium]